MEPASIAGIVGTALAIAEVVAKTVSKLSSLRTKYRDADLSVSTLIGQLYTIDGALQQLGSWASSGNSQGPQIEQLASHLEVALDTCRKLICWLDERVNQLNRTGEGELSVRGKTLYLWSERDMNDYLIRLNIQVNVLNLLLHTIQLEQPSAQRAIMEEEESLTLLRISRDCSSSVGGMRVGSCTSKRSSITDTTDRLSLEFEFDSELFGTRAYQNASKSNLRRRVADDKARRGAKRMGDTDASSTFESDSDSTKHDVLTLKPEANSEESNMKPGCTVSVPSKENLGHQEYPADVIHRRVSADVTWEPMKDQKCQDSAIIKAEWDFKAKRRQARELFRINSRQEKHSGKRGELDARNSLRVPRPARREETGSVTRLVILGDSNSGKTTLLRSLMLHNKPGRLHEYNARDFKEAIFDTVVNSMLALFESMEAGDISLLDANDVEHITTADVGGCDFLPQKIAKAIQNLWVDQGLQAVYQIKREFLGSKDPGYWVRRIPQISTPGYIPSPQDVLRARVTTTGIYEAARTAFGTELRVCDVGGARSEQWKWFGLLPNANFLIFTVDVASCSDGFSPLSFCLSDRLQEQMHLFEIVVNYSKLPSETSVILVFTKLDELRLKLQLDVAWSLSNKQDAAIDSFMHNIADQFTVLSRKSSRIETIFAGLDDTFERPSEAILKIVERMLQEKAAKGVDRIRPVSQTNGNSLLVKAARRPHQGITLDGPASFFAGSDTNASPSLTYLTAEREVHNGTEEAWQSTEGTPLQQTGLAV